MAKVLVGFKCSPALRAKLEYEANKLGMSLSGFTEDFIENAFSNILRLRRENILLSLKLMNLQNRLKQNENLG